MRNITLSLAALCAASFAFGSDLSTLRKVIDAKNADFMKAMKRKDISWFQKQAAPNFVEIEKGQKMNLAQSLELMKQMFSMTKSVVSIDTKIRSLKMQGKDVVVLTDNSFVGMLTVGSKTGKLVDKSVEEDIWTPVGKDWKIKQVKTISETATLDGKPFGV